MLSPKRKITDYIQAITTGIGRSTGRRSVILRLECGHEHRMPEARFEALRGDRVKCVDCDYLIHLSPGNLKLPYAKERLAEMKPLYATEIVVAARPRRDRL